MKEEKTIPFNPKDPEHLKGFERTIKKMVKMTDKTQPQGILLTKEEFDIIKKVAPSGFKKR